MGSKKNLKAAKVASLSVEALAQTDEALNRTNLATASQLFVKTLIVAEARNRVEMAAMPVVESKYGLRAPALVESYQNAWKAGKAEREGALQSVNVQERLLKDSLDGKFNGPCDCQSRMSGAKLVERIYQVAAWCSLLGHEPKPGARYSTCASCYAEWRTVLDEVSPEVIRAACVHEGHHNGWLKSAAATEYTEETNSDGETVCHGVGFGRKVVVTDLVKEWKVVEHVWKNQHGSGIKYSLKEIVTPTVIYPIEGRHNPFEKGNVDLHRLESARTIRKDDLSAENSHLDIEERVNETMHEHSPWEPYHFQLATQVIWKDGKPRQGRGLARQSKLVLNPKPRPSIARKTVPNVVVKGITWANTATEVRFDGTRFLPGQAIHEKIVDAETNGTKVLYEYPIGPRDLVATEFIQSLDYAGVDETVVGSLVRYQGGLFIPMGKLRRRMLLKTLVTHPIAGTFCHEDRTINTYEACPKTAHVFAKGCRPVDQQAWTFIDPNIGGQASLVERWVRPDDSWSSSFYFKIEELSSFGPYYRADSKILETEAGHKWDTPFQHVKDEDGSHSWVSTGKYPMEIEEKQLKRILKKLVSHRFGYEEYQHGWEKISFRGAPMVVRPLSWRVPVKHPVLKQFHTAFPVYECRDCGPVPHVRDDARWGDSLADLVCPNHRDGTHSRPKYWGRSKEWTCVCCGNTKATHSIRANITFSLKTKAREYALDVNGKVKPCWDRALYCAVVTIHGRLAEEIAAKLRTNDLFRATDGTAWVSGLQPRKSFYDTLSPQGGCSIAVA